MENQQYPLEWTALWRDQKDQLKNWELTAVTENTMEFAQETCKLGLPHSTGIAFLGIITYRIESASKWDICISIANVAVT